MTTADATASDSIGPSGSHGRYRPDIDGLRAFAVCAVVLFHAGIPALSGGFVGVDVFFVISGYLITQILLRDDSIVRFYQRRARRILPALFVMLAVVLIAGLCVILPHDLSEVSKSAGATVLFFSNIFFWQQAGYFAVGTELWPLLHTWSLGVEEQYYIVFPLIVRLMRRVRVMRVAAVFAALAIASFALAQYGIDARKQTFVFYASPTRAWELLVGSILATGVLPAMRATWLRSAASALGLAGVLVPVFLYTSATPFPGAGALAPVLGTALLIWSGGSGPHALLPVLRWEPFRRIGLISYSLYLWHWPILALARYVAIDPLTTTQTICAVAGAFVAAWLSWRYVERPFRRGVSDRAIWGLSATGMVLLLAGSGAIILLQGVPSRVPPQIRALNAAQGSTWRCPVTSMVSFGHFYACPLNSSSRRVEDADIVLWGDSHAQMYVPALLGGLGERHAILVDASGCAPVLGEAAGAACGAVQRANYAAIVKLPARTVILAQNWPQTRDEFAKRVHRELRPSERYALGVERLRLLVGGLRRAGKRVFIVTPIPIPDYEISSTLSRSLWFYGRIRNPIVMTKSAYLKEYENVFALFDTLQSDPGVTIVDSYRGSCDARLCHFIIDGEPIFSDRGHYTAKFSGTLRPLFATALERQ
ncbi:MAG: acyltransferase [Bradyrhizobium sp.]|nr:acyltransferase [Bradyrhizobium sp.]